MRAHVTPHLLLLLLVIPLGMTFFLLAQRLPGISDPLGYVYAAERLAAGEGLTYADPRNADIGPFFSLYAFQIEREPGAALHFGFPPGLPVLMAIAPALTGRPDTVHTVVPLLAVLGLLTTYAFAVRLTGDRWTALLSAVLVAQTAVFWQFGTAAWSEAPSLTMLTAGFAAYLAARQSAGRRATLWAVIAAALLVGSLFLRYTNVALLPALLIYEWLARPRRLSAVWPTYAGLAAGAAAILLFNTLYYGGPAVTGYSPVHGWYPWPAFSTAYAFGPSFIDGFSVVAAGQTLVANFHLFLLLLPLGIWRLGRPAGGLTAVASLGPLALFGVYAFAAAGINSRFLLPIFPFLAVPMATAVVALGRRLPATGRPLATLALLALLLWPLPGHIAALQARNAADTAQVARVHALTVASPPDAVFLSYLLNDQLVVYGERAVLNYRRIPPSDPVSGRYVKETLEPCLAGAVAILLSGGTPVYYVADVTPSYWASQEILARYFELVAVAGDPPVFRLQARDEGTPPLPQGGCPR